MNHSELVSFLWGVADLIRDTFKRGKYQDVVLPLTVLRRLDRETAKIDALVAKVREAIDSLKELRTALISAAVTGKIDVWEEAA